MYPQNSPFQNVTDVDLLHQKPVNINNLKIILFIFFIAFFQNIHSQGYVTNPLDPSYLNTKYKNAKKKTKARHKRFYDGNSKYMSGQFDKLGRRTGYWKIYFEWYHAPNYRLAAEGNYEAGQRIGKWYFYKTKGKIYKRKKI